jgi:hypothetical protein
MVASPGLLALMAVACGGGKDVNQTIQDINTPRVEQADSTLVITKTEVFSPTQTLSPTLTPIETPEPIVYIDPIPYEKVITVKVLRDQLENGFGGGYFIGVPDVENIEEYLIVDFSQQGILRVIEGKDLNTNSWGLYVAKKFRGHGSGGDGQGVSLIILHALYNNQQSLSVEWGDLEPGTKIFLPQYYIDDVKKTLNPPDVYFSKNFPLDDPRFNCEEVETVPSGNGTYNSPGKLCVYKGN